MKKKNVISILLIIFFIMCIPCSSFAADFDLSVKFDGKSNITMESETEDMNWDLNCLLPGQKDISTLNVSNDGKAPVKLKIIISIEENNGLLEMVDVSVKDKSGIEVYNGKYTEMKEIIKTINPGNIESYTVDVGMNVNAGNEYQNKEYKLKFNFVASGDVNNGTLTIRYVDEDGKDIATSEIKSGLITEEYDELPSIGKKIDGYEFVSVDGKLKDYYQVEGSTVTYKYKKVQQYGNLSVKWVSDSENGKVLKSYSDKQKVGTHYKYEPVNISGYKFNGKIEGNAEGDYTEKNSEIVFHYDKVEEKNRGNVIVLYVDEDGKEIGRKQDSDEVGKTYSYTDEDIIREIPGYTFKRIDGEKTGVFKEQDTIIYCRYEKIKRGNVIVVCIDENNEIIKRTVTTEIVGTEYNLGEVGEQIEGYTFLGVDGETKGKYKVEDTIVIYRYRKNVPSTNVVTKPKTGDNIIKYVVIGIAVLVLLIIIVIIKKKNNKEK